MEIYISSWVTALNCILPKFKNISIIFIPVPLVSKVCPSDVYRVWKSGSCLRVDTTLLGFEHMTWLKGRRSYIFKGGGAYASQAFIIHACCSITHGSNACCGWTSSFQMMVPWWWRSTTRSRSCTQSRWCCLRGMRPPSWQPCSLRKRTQHRD